MKTNDTSASCTRRPYTALTCMKSHQCDALTCLQSSLAQYPPLIEVLAGMESSLVFSPNLPAVLTLSDRLSARRRPHAAGERPGHALRLPLQVQQPLVLRVHVGGPRGQPPLVRHHPPLRPGREVGLLPHTRYTHTHTRMHTHATITRTHTRTRTHGRTCTRTHRRTCTHRHTNTRVCTHTHTHTHMHAHKHAWGFIL